uniref:CCR4-NOT transcription complex subunit 9 n=1 Tax=Eptatretus burgeri TaxID=7764 RepID=A0A8C4N1M9_EPTBU
MTAPNPNASAIERRELKKIYTWINEISSLQTRENALLELCKKQESVPDLAPMLWHSFGTAAALLEVQHVLLHHSCFGFLL